MAGDIEVAADIAIKRYQGPGLNHGQRGLWDLKEWLEGRLCDVNEDVQTMAAADDVGMAVTMCDCMYVQLTS